MTDCLNRFCFTIGYGPRQFVQRKIVWKHLVHRSSCCDNWAEDSRDILDFWGHDVHHHYVQKEMLE